MVDNTLATEILMTQVILDYKSVLWEIFLFGLINAFIKFSVNGHVLAS